MCLCRNSAIMINIHFMYVCATLACLYVATNAEGGIPTPEVKIPRTRFSCQGKPAGYYADLETGCQVYHMCDDLGRQFSYTCPNTTLFQQRMLICDHWYMVNCSMSERDYGANLLIGQRDKPFVSDEEMSLRTPRPDILSVPPNSNYYDGLREAETKFPLHPDNSIVGLVDSISSANNNGLDSGKRSYKPPTSWSMGTKKHSTRSKTNIEAKDVDNFAGAASEGPRPTFQPTPVDNSFKRNIANNIKPPLTVLSPPFAPPKTEDTDDLEGPAKDASEDAVFKFIKRFDPNSPDSHKTSMTQSEIINLNKQLPPGQSSTEEDKSRQSSEEEKTPTKNKDLSNKRFNTFKDDNDKTFLQGSKFDSVNSKPSPPNAPATYSDIPVPERVLQPPKTDYSSIPSTTMGPPIYYEWKWAVPAFALELPKVDDANATNTTNTHQTRSIQGRSPFSSVMRPTPVTVDPTPSNVEYNISSYFVPDYIFPLDKPHPGYENDDAQTSFQVEVSRPGRASYGENPDCPHCHPAYLVPGTCEPCTVKR